MRLFRILSMNGIPRSEGKQLIKQGRVTSAESVLADGNQDVSGDVFLDGEKLRGDEEVHIMLYKPAGVLTATQDSRTETVMDLLPVRLQRIGLGPVGRLDKDATGLLILTTDGQLAHRLISPKWDEEKVYEAHTEGVPDQAAIDLFAAGMELSDFTAKPAKLAVLEDRGETAVCQVIVSEGKFHQVKRMLAHVGCPVTALKRVQVAGLRLDEDLQPGEWRYLTQEEAQGLYTCVRLSKNDF